MNQAAAHFHCASTSERQPSAQQRAKLREQRERAVSTRRCPINCQNVVSETRLWSREDGRPQHARGTSLCVVKPRKGRHKRRRVRQDLALRFAVRPQRCVCRAIGEFKQASRGELLHSDQGEAGLQRQFV